MPIYEYLCPACNRVYSFLSKSAAEAKSPVCPKCGAQNLRKMVSKFAFVGGTRKSKGKPATEPSSAPEDKMADAMDDPRVEHEMMKLMADAESVDENDPRQLGHLMRRMSTITGESMGPEMEEAIRRLESGEDPEKIEEDMGDILGDGEDDEMGGMGGPSYDDGLYPM